MRIAVYQRLGIGDLLCTLPALRALRSLSERPLEFHGDLSLLELALDDGLLAPPTADELDVIVNLHGVGPESHAALPVAKKTIAFWDPQVHPTGPRWRHGLGMREQWCRLLAAHGIDAEPRDYLLSDPPRQEQIVVHVGAKDHDRQWPLERWREVVRSLADDHDVLVTSADTAAGARIAESTGARWIETTLQEWQDEIATSRLLITVDSGAAHLAFAHRTPAVVLYGPAPASVWAPPDAHAHPLGNLATISKPCPQGPLNGHLERVTPEEVLNTASACLIKDCP